MIRRTSASPDVEGHPSSRAAAPSRSAARGDLQPGSARGALRARSPPRIGWPRTLAAAVRCFPGSTRAPRGSRKPTGSFGRRLAPTRSPVSSEDWLRDNHHVVQDQVREIRQDLPRNYYLELPEARRRSLPGLPARLPPGRASSSPIRPGGRSRNARRFRHRLPAHVAALDRRNLGDPDHAAARARRGAAPPCRRRRRGAAKPREGAAVARGTGRRSADWTERKHPAAARGRTAGRQPAVGGVRGGAAAMAARPALDGGPAWQALQQALQDQDDSADEMLRIEHQREAADQLAIGNVITSMRRVSSIDWTLFFERVSLVEQPAARRSGRRVRADGLPHARSLSPFDRAAGQARAAHRNRRRPPRHRAGARPRCATSPATIARHHVGYYLISRGRFRLERDVGYRPRLRERLARFAFRAPGRRLPRRRSRAMTRRQRGQPARVRGAAAAPRTRSCGSSPLVVLLPVSELVISLLQSDHHGAGAAASAAQARHARRHPAGTIGRSSPCPRSSIRRRVFGPARRSRGPLPRQPRRHISTSRCSATFPTPISRRGKETTRSSTIARKRIDELNARYGAGRFFFFHRDRRWNAGEGAGWDGNASAASSRSSTACCAARRTRASRSATATCPCCRR